MLTNLTRGSTTDSLVVSSTGKGELIWYNSAGIEGGRLIALTVKEGILKFLEKQNKLKTYRSLWKRLEERGVFIDHFMRIVENNFFSQFYQQESINDLLGEKVFRKELEEVLLREGEVCSLVMAELGLEEEKRRGLIPYKAEIDLQKGSKGDIHRLPSRVFGRTVAEYVDGNSGLKLYGKSVKIFGKTEVNPLKDEMTITMFYILSGIVGGVVGRIDQKRTQRE